MPRRSACFDRRARSSWRGRCRLRAHTPEGPGRLRARARARHHEARSATITSPPPRCRGCNTSSRRRLGRRPLRSALRRRPSRWQRSNRPPSLSTCVARGRGCARSTRQRSDESGSRSPTCSSRRQRSTVGRALQSCTSPCPTRNESALCTPAHARPRVAGAIQPGESRALSSHPRGSVVSVGLSSYADAERGGCAWWLLASHGAGEGQTSVGC